MKKYVKSETDSPTSNAGKETQLSSPFHTFQPPNPFSEDRNPFQTSPYLHHQNNSTLPPLSDNLSQQNSLKRDLSILSDTSVKMETPTPMDHLKPSLFLQQQQQQQQQILNQQQFQQMFLQQQQQQPQQQQQNKIEFQEMYEKFMWMQNQMFYNCFQQNMMQQMQFLSGDFQQNMFQLLQEKLKQQQQQNNSQKENSQEKSQEPSLQQNKKQKRKRTTNSNNNREETKNLLKIYSLGFHKYIEHTFTEMFGVKKPEIMAYLQNNRLESYTLKGLRHMWERNDAQKDEQIKKYNKIIRIYCKRFLQGEALSYFLTHSRTKNPFIILKYRSVLLQFLYEPQNLRYLKLRDSASSSNDSDNDLQQQQQELGLERQASSFIDEQQQQEQQSNKNNHILLNQSRKIKKFKNVKLEEEEKQSSDDTVKI